MPGFDATEGFRPGVGSDLYAEGEAERTGYKKTDGCLAVPRRTAGGGSPLVDPAKGASQFVVNIIDGDQVSTFQPGATDSFGDPISKEASCQNSPVPVIPSPPSLPSAPVPSPEMACSPTATTPMPSPKPPTRKPRRQSSEETTPLPPSLQEDVSFLKSQLSSLMNASLKPAPESTSPPSSSSPRTSTETVEISTDFGVLTFEVSGVDISNPDLMVLIWDPKKPKLLPKGGAGIKIMWKDTLYECQSSGLNLTVTIQGQEVVLTVLVLLKAGA